MPRFLYLCVGGDVPAEKREDNMAEWGAFMGSVAATGKMRDGAPFGEPSKTMSGDDSARTFDWKTDSDTSGYWIVEAGDIDEAVAMAKGCPHFRYGGTVEVRQLLEMGPQ